MGRRIWIWGLIAYAILRWVLLANPGYVFDVQAYKRWTLQAARNGISEVYRTSDMDYPPLYAYILAPLGKIYGWLSPTALEHLEDSTLLTVLVKFPPLLFDLAIALLLFGIARRRKGGGSDRSPWIWLMPAAFLLNPAVLFNDGYWGEPDSVHSFFVLAAFLALGTRRIWPAWALLTLATLMKPLGAPFFPLLLVLSLALGGLRPTLVGIGAAAGTTLLVFAPFLVHGQGVEVARRVIGDVGLMAYTSSNAHNLWWVLGPWRDAEKPWLGPLTSTQVSLGLFALAYAALLWKAHRLHRREPGGLQPAQILALAGAVGFSFFMLSTHMHENHLYILMPLLAPLLPCGPRWRWLFAAASLGILMNLVLHDLAIPTHWPFTLGGPAGILNPHMKRPFFKAELALIWISTVYNLALFGIFFYGIIRREKGLLESLRPSSA